MTMSPFKKKWFLRYVLVLACLAFAGRATPLAFLPLVLQDQFHQSSTVVGVIMALYPVAALITTPWAARIARETQRIVTLHSIAIVMIAVALVANAGGTLVQQLMGNDAGALWMGISRVLQGVGASFYLSSNTCLLARKFPDQLTYVIALTEVAVGAGGQVGRLVGGFLYDWGGLSCPFIVIACLQTSFGLAGLVFEDGGDSVCDDAEADADDDEKEPPVSKIPWATLITMRLCVGALGAFMQYFVDCFSAATLLQYMSVHLAPTNVGEMNVALAFRAVTYLTVSWLLAQLMHREVLSCEFLITFGSVLVLIGYCLMAPQPFVTSMEAAITGSAPSYAAMWATQVMSFIVASGGGACLFVPSLPLMQQEVRKHGQIAIEQVCELFVIMMTLGEMLGPIFGGWLVQQVGFPVSSLMFALLLIPTFLFSLASYDSAVVRARCQEAHHGGDFKGTDRGGFVAPSDPDANFSVRRLPFAIDVRRHAGTFRMEGINSAGARLGGALGAGAEPLLNDLGDHPKIPKTAPSETFRKKYVPVAPGAK